jgi:hypothetical protein
VLLAFAEVGRGDALQTSLAPENRLVCRPNPEPAGLHVFQRVKIELIGHHLHSADAAADLWKVMLFSPRFRLLRLDTIDNGMRREIVPGTDSFLQTIPKNVACGA